MTEPTQQTQPVDQLVPTPAPHVTVNDFKYWTCPECHKTIKSQSKWAHVNYVHGDKKKQPKKRKTIDFEDPSETDKTFKNLKRIVSDFLIRDCPACEHYACKSGCPLKSFREKLRVAL
jgi:Fe-S-cluster-containing dehydrogenase component